MRLFAIAFLLLFAYINCEKPHVFAQQPSSQKRATETSEQNAQNKTANNAPVVGECIGCFSVNEPKAEDQQHQSYDAKKDSLYRWYLVATIIGVMGAWVGLCVIYRQTKATEKAANAARDNAIAVINAERAWIFADILPTIGNGRFVDLENGNTSIYVRINCKNVGRSPAWIIEVRMRFMFIRADTLPPVPRLEDAEQVWAGTHPIGPKDEPFSTGDYTLTAHGIQGIDSATGELAVIYGIIRYRDIYQKARQTTFGYRLERPPDF